MNVAGYDKDINDLASKEEFMIQAREYRDMIKESKWNKTLEFLALRKRDHPLMTVRALECEEWVKTDQFISILNGTYKNKNTESLAKLTAIDVKNKGEETVKESVSGFEYPKHKRKDGKKLAEIDEIRLFKELLDEGSSPKNIKWK